MSSPPESHARFTSPYDARGLPDAVRAVALHCRPEAPQTVSQRQFDRGRAAVPEHAQAPSARQICSRLGVSWRPLLEALFEPGRDIDMFVAHKQRSKEDHDLGDDQVRAALRTTAARLGVVTLRPAEYDAARAQLLAEDRRRYRHGRSLRLPTANQIARVAGTWDRALEISAPQERPSTTGPRPPAVSYHEAIRRFLESQGAMPTSKELAQFASVQGFPLPRRPTDGHAHALVEVQAQFAAEGRWAPATYPPKNQRPSYDFELEQTRRPGEQRRVKRRTKEECVAGVIAYLEQIQAGEKVTQKRYLAWAVGTEHPSTSAFDRHGGWTALLAEARVERRTAGP